MIPSRLRSLPIAILILAAILRAGFLYKNWNNLDFAPSFLMHAEVARNILQGHWFQINKPYLESYVHDCQLEQKLIDPQDYPSPTTETLTPLYDDEGGYGLFLAVVWKLTGVRRWWFVRALQVVLDLVACWLLYSTGKKLFGERVGLMTALLYACFIPGIELVIRPHRDIWVTFLFIFTTYSLASLDQSRRPVWRMIAIGLAIGVVAWMRSTVLLFAVLMVPLLFAVRVRREAVRFSAAVVLAFALAFSPLVIRNYIVFDKFMATRGAFWHSFWAGVGQTPNPFNVRDDDDVIVAFARSIDSTARLDTDHYEQVLKQKAVTFIGEHPFWYAGSVVKRGVVFIFPKIGRELFFQPQLPQHVTGTINLAFGKIILLLVDGVMSSFFLAGIWISRKRWKETLPVMYPYLYTLATLAPFYLAGRNIMNVYFVVFMLASVSLVYLWERYTRNSNRPL
jgi:hypothetical protein